jgi:hypothetical protein
VRAFASGASSFARPTDRWGNLPDGRKRVKLSTVPLVCNAPPKQPACRANVELTCRGR